MHMKREGFSMIRYAIKYNGKWLYWGESIALQTIYVNSKSSIEEVEEEIRGRLKNSGTDLDKYSIVPIIGLYDQLPEVVYHAGEWR